MEAVRSGGSSPPFDMGALFGLGVKPGADMEQGMRWEGPQLPGTGLDSTHWTQKSRLWKRRQQEDKRVAAFLEIPEDPIEKSRAGFEALLAAVPDTTVIGRVDIEPLLAYLQSPENEPEARLTARLLGWLQAKSASEDCISALVNVAKWKLKLETILEDEADQILRGLRKHRETNGHFVAIASSLSRDWASRILVGVTRDILESTDDESRLQELNQWLTCLRKCVYVKGFGKATSEGWHRVYGEISKYYKPSDLADHFSKLQRRRTAGLLLRHWVPKLATHSNEDGPTFLDSRHGKILRHHPAEPKDFDVAMLAEELRTLHAEQVSDPERTYRRSPLVDLVQVLAEKKLPYQQILEEILSIYSQTEPASKLRTIVLDLVRTPSVDIPTALATTVVQSFMASENPEHALQVFEAVPTISLSSCYDLPLQLIGKKGFHGEKTFMMLNRLVPEDTIAPAQRSVRTLSLNQAHIDIVHLIAYAFAKSPHLPPRVALRRVWECYRFLRDRQAPLDPLMSRALVKAGISRPLSEGKRPSASQTAYILHLVQKFEGEEMAQRLDALVFELGKKVARGDFGFLGTRWARSQEKRESKDDALVNAARWRLWRWRRKGWCTPRLRVAERYRSRNVGASRADTLREVPSGQADVEGTATAPVMDVHLTAETGQQATQYAPLNVETKRLNEDEGLLMGPQMTVAVDSQAAEAAGEACTGVERNERGRTGLPSVSEGKEDAGGDGGGETAGSVSAMYHRV